MKDVELPSSYIVLELPDETVEVEIVATIFHDGGTMKVRKKLGLIEVRNAFKEAEDGYIPSDAMFTLTDKSRAYLDELERRRGDG